jgi:acyl-CoA dehydrogenase
MDFDDTPDEAQFRAECRAWLDKHARLRAVGEDVDYAPRDPKVIAASQAWQAKKADAGWACITWPKEYGGRGATAIQNVIWNQEEARYDTPPSLFGIGQGMLGPTIMAHGTDAQKQRYLRPMLRGEEIWCQLFSEPAAGSDLGGLRTRAERDGDEWVLNGQKIWTTGAHYSKWGMIVARSDPRAVKHKGITYFVVDMHAPGVEVRPIKQMNGHASFNEVFFTDARVPHANIIGREHEGWRGAITTLMNERASIGAGGGGGGVDELIALARRVTLDGRPALEDSSVRQRIARFYIRSKGVRYAGLRTLTALSRGQTPGPESSIGKLVGAPLRQEIAAFALELEGAAGVIDDETHGAGSASWLQMYLRSPGMRIAGGTDEILRNIVAERVLGLPSEIRVDKDVPFTDIPTGR